ncbi:peptidyl-tRNA hydrolase [Glutamicibacter endophyticus]|uniref:peptidyl-tRNA hydrolase n=1 Tax=Glutamicibacter endophyticus TaxID=1522174 RepID=UPI003AF102C9
MISENERDPLELVQPIILRIDKHDPPSAEEAISAVARAAVLAYLSAPQDERWQLWAQQAFAKSVRRANPKFFARVLEETEHGMISEVGKAQAVGLLPLPAAGLPKLIAKLQVSGTQLEPDEQGLRAPVTIALNLGLGMSTGKAAAQAAHALFAWLIEAPAPQVEAWLKEHAPVGVLWLERREFAAVASRAVGPVIQDAGRTEIEPGSSTAYVLQTEV